MDLCASFQLRQSMNRRLRQLGNGGLAALVSFVAAWPVGCATEQQTRLQAEDEIVQVKYDVKTVGDITTFGETDPIQLGGAGLVMGLENTGGDPPPGLYRQMLQDQLMKEGIKNWKEILASKTTSIVVLTAQLPAGAKKGDKIDVQVSLPPGSKTTSLRGGILRECTLFNYDSTQRLSGNGDGSSDQMLKGHPLAKAEGAIQVGLGDSEERSRLRQGVIWGGGESRIDRAFNLIMNQDQQFARVASLVADRVNETFHGPFRGPLGGEMAVAKNGTQIVLNIPEQYRHNLPRYLRVIRMIPISEDMAATKRSGQNKDETKLSYRRRLEQDLLDPAHTVTAALRLEALGESSIPPLKAGLKSESALVRFCAAESLAYLGSPSSALELSRLIQSQPAVRAFCLTALASLQESVSHLELRKMLSSNIPEVRYGAFRALRALDEREESIPGEMLNDAFWLHHVAPDSEPLVHLSSSRRAEVVLFGEEAFLKAPFAFNAGDFAVTAGDGDDHCTISYCSVRQGISHRQCSLSIDEVVKTMARMGARYPEVVETLRQANSCKCLTCDLAIDALPQAVSIQTLAKAGVRSKGQEIEVDDDETDAEIRKAQAEFGVTPNIFQKEKGRRSLAAKSEGVEPSTEGGKPAAEPATIREND
ncbi:MAG TPA: flagellar basal body P-ring protein FlgI [Gemmataceae bacterium]|nr:flagellar basal body P-ring protein FlgI [Gemmataceae bacterium]